MPTFTELKERVQDSLGQELKLEDYILVSKIQTMFQENKGRVMDANETMATVRALTNFLNTVYQVKTYPSLKFMEALPYNPAQFDKNAKSVGWYTGEDIGNLDFLANGAGDLNTLTADLKEKTVDVKVAGARIVWTWEDLEAAIFMGKALPAQLGQTARRLTDKFHDDITARGSAKYGVDGLLSNPTAMTLQTGLTWSGLSTIDDKVEAIKALARKVSTATSSTWEAGLVILPPVYYEELEDAGYGDNKDKTALDGLEYAFRRRNIRIISWQQFSNVTDVDGITSGKDVAMALPFTPEVAENMIVDPFFMKPPKEDVNYNVSAGVYTKTAGVVKRIPKACVYGYLT